MYGQPTQERKVYPKNVKRSGWPISKVRV